MDSKIESQSFKMFINGEWVETQSGKTIERHSPAHDVLVSTYPEASKLETESAIAAAKAALSNQQWTSLTGAERESLLRKVAALIRERSESLARVECLESGKPLLQAIDEMGWAAGHWEYAAALCRTLHGDTYNTLGASALGMTLREPIGVVGMITPWNFPLLVISQKLPFALAAGCTAVVKPSEFTSGTTLMLGKLMQEAGFPDGVVNIVTGYGDPVGSTLAEHDDVDMVTFTGSTAVGKKIVGASQHNLKKVALELGGKNPQILFPDADLEAALDAVVFGVYFNMGECCNSGSRVLLHESIADEFVEKIVERARTVPVGDPLDPKTKVGAIINAAQNKKILDYIAEGKAAGAELKLGGAAVESEDGAYIAPTVFDRVTPDMAIAKEEIFGPVLSILRFSDAEEALAIANNACYGLSASVWTRDVDTAFTMAKGIQAGTVWINTFMDGASELPFGGYKQSGQGRELGRFSVEEYSETKTVYLHLGPREGLWHSPE